MENQTSLSELKNNVRPGDNAVSVGLVDGQSFALAQRIATMLSASTLVPARYQGNIGNCVIALNMANRIGADPLMVMQNLYVVHGTPAWSAQFLVACFNKCGRFSSIRYEFFGEEGTDEWGCRAWAIERETGEKIHGTKITIAMAKQNGWYNKPDKYGKESSKWPVMPQQMLMYRAASWFVRAYAPEIAMGLHTAEEIRDTYDMEPAEDGAFTVSDLRGQAHQAEPAADPEETYACPDEEGIRIKASVCAKCAKAKDCPEYGPGHQQ